MKNVNLSAFTILAPDVVQYGFSPFKILYKFGHDENGKTKKVEVFKRQPLTGKIVWGLYTESLHASTFYSMIRVERGLFNGEEVLDLDVNWATHGLHFENVIDEDFQKFEKSLKKLGKNFAFRNIIFIFVM